MDAGWENEMKYTMDGFKCMLLAALAAGLAVQTGSAQTIVDSLQTTNASGTNIFVSKVGVGTNNPASLLHVAGDLTVSGAMKVAKQGDVSMGSYTNGESVNGISGAGGSAAVAFTNMIGTNTYANTGFNLQPGSNLSFRVSGGTNYFDGQSGGGGGFMPCVFKVNMASNISPMSADTYYRMQYTSVVYQTVAGSCVSNGMFKVPTGYSGYYVFVGVAKDTESRSCMYKLQINGVDYLGVADAATGYYGNGMNTVVFGPVRLNDLDVVSFYFAVNYYSGKTLDTNTNKNYFCGWRVAN